MRLFPAMHPIIRGVFSAFALNITWRLTRWLDYCTWCFLSLSVFQLHFTCVSVYPRMWVCVVCKLQKTSVSFWSLFSFLSVNNSPCQLFPRTKERKKSDDDFNFIRPQKKRIVSFAKSRISQYSAAGIRWNGEQKHPLACDVRVNDHSVTRSSQIETLVFSGLCCVFTWSHRRAWREREKERLTIYFFITFPLSRKNTYE